MADGAAPDVRLGDLVHRDRAHHPGRDPDVLERVLERQAVHDRGKHPDVVARRPIHTAGCGSEAPKDVAASDHDSDLDAETMDFGDLAGDDRDEGRIDAVCPVA
jgi:hypothetical protein